MDLRQVVVRPIRAEERQAFDRLLVEHHYLKSSVLVGEALRYVATVGERWLALCRRSRCAGSRMASAVTLRRLEKGLSNRSSSAIGQLLDLVP